MEYAPIENQMKLWRKGLISLPQDYIDYHRILAEKAITDLTNKGYTIHRQWMTTDSYGMLLKHLVVETSKKDLIKLKWSDSHSTGKWFEILKVGGSVPHEVIC